MLRAALRVARVRLGVCMLVPLQDADARCCLLLSEWRVGMPGCCFKGTVRLELAYAAYAARGAAKWCALWRGHAGATALLQGRLSVRCALAA